MVGRNDHKKVTKKPRRLEKNIINHSLFTFKKMILYFNLNKQINKND